MRIWAIYHSGQGLGHDLNEPLEGADVLYMTSAVVIAEDEWGARQVAAQHHKDEDPLEWTVFARVTELGIAHADEQHPRLIMRVVI